MFRGSLVALITPMLANGSIDKKALHDLVEWHIQEKTDGLVIIGTTGESATIEPEERQEIMELVVKQVAKRLPVIVGTGTNATKSSVYFTEQAEKAGVDGVLVVTPYYNRPTQLGLIHHYKTIAESTSLPVIAYNVTARTGCDLLPETIEQIAKVPNIIGIKEAIGKIERGIEIRERCGKNFAIYSGDDATALYWMLQGVADGVISVTANVAPRKMHDLCQAALTGNTLIAQAINSKLIPLHQKLFIEPNPIPVKWALHKMGKTALGIRSPLLPLDANYHSQLIDALVHADILPTT